MRCDPTSPTRPAWLRACAALLLAIALPGCAVLRQFGPQVAVEPMEPAEYIALQRGDILTTGRLSTATVQTLRAAGLEDGACAKPSPACIAALPEVPGIDDERRLSALSELWLQQALTSPSKGGPVRDDPAAAARLQAFLEAARHAYAYLFFTPRSPGDRAFEDRQTQVRDWYNQAVQAATTQMFEAGAHKPAGEVASTDGTDIAGWRVRTDTSRINLPDGVVLPQELVPASSLSFSGLHAIYRRDGFGAELVAVMADDPVTVARPRAGGSDAAAVDAVPEAGDPVIVRGDAAPRRGPRRPPPAWSEMPSPSLTVLFRFAGDNLESVLRTRELQLSVHDPYAEEAVLLHGQRVPLAANFSAGYGLWLARSGFNVQSLQTLFGREHGIERPHLYMMQPFDPDRRIVLMLHGLASSPEAWVNVGNEIMGDAALRRGYQVWQVYYPTNLPLAYNHDAIRRLVDDALRTMDPAGLTPAAHDMVVVGHSMGGVIARLMVSSSDDDALWDATVAPRLADMPAERQARIRERVAPMLRFRPMPQVGRAVFIAAPHRGTGAAETKLGRWVGNLVRLPVTVAEGFADLLDDNPAPGERTRLPNSIDNLSASDPFVRAAADLPMAPGLPVHSIIARSGTDGPLEDSGDGLVPYRSAHLPAARSELVIASGHSVQATVPAILEVRRVLHLDLAE